MATVRLSGTSVGLVPNPGRELGKRLFLATEAREHAFVPPSLFCLTLGVHWTAGVLYPSKTANQCSRSLLDTHKVLRSEKAMVSRRQCSRHATTHVSPSRQALDPLPFPVFLSQESYCMHPQLHRSRFKSLNQNPQTLQSGETLHGKF